jgi:hypothetical protein
MVREWVTNKMSLISCLLVHGCCLMVPTVGKKRAKAPLHVSNWVTQAIQWQPFSLVMQKLSAYKGWLGAWTVSSHVNIFMVTKLRSIYLIPHVLMWSDKRYMQLAMHVCIQWIKPTNGRVWSRCEYPMDHFFCRTYFPFSSLGQMRRILSARGWSCCLISWQVATRHNCKKKYHGNSCRLIE